MTPADRLAAFKDETLLAAAEEEVKALGCPASADKISIEGLDKTTIEGVIEYFKIAKPEAKEADSLAVSALEKDPKVQHKVQAAETLHKRLTKLGADGAAFKAKAA